MFFDRLASAVAAKGTPLMVGLDPRRELLPPGLRPDRPSPSATAAAFESFCREVLAVVAPYVAVVKPQVAFFEQLGPPGMTALARVIEAARREGLLVIADAKRNDIGSTAEAYARGWLGEDSAWQADALTVSPYLGRDSLEPFFDIARDRGCGIFVLAKTSNPGSGDLQDLACNQQPIYEEVAAWLETLSVATPGTCGYGLAGAVVGATYPEALASLRRRAPHVWFLVPGFGAQGGSAAAVKAAFDERGLGAVVNSSRGILFAYHRAPYAERFGEARWQEAVEAATRDAIAALREAGISPG